MKQKNIFILLAAAILTSGLFVSCGSAESTETTAETAADNTAETAAETDENAIPADKLPALDYGGEEFRAMTRLKWFFHGELFLEESTGEILNDARFEAKAAVEDRLNVEFREEYYGTIDYNDNDAPRTIIQAGDDAYDMFNGRHVNLFNYASEGMIHKITDIPYIDRDMPWWDEDFSRQLIVGETEYFGIAAFNLTAYDSIHMFLFNKEMAKDYSIGDLYGMVKEGTWTYDAMNEAMSKVVSDLNGDGVMGEEDQYGLISAPKQILPTLLLGGGHYMIDKDGDNFLYNSMEGNEAFFNAYNKIMDIAWTDSHWYPFVTATEADEQLLITLFSENHSLFANSTGCNVSYYRTMDMDFGILPCPKETAEQQDYYSRSEYPELFGIPLSNTNLEMTGAVLEALASEFLRSVEPAYFDVTLTGKVARDTDSAEMLDIIYSNRVFDFGDTILCSEIRDGKIKTNMENNVRDLASTLASIRNTVQKRLDTINQGFGLE